VSAFLLSHFQAAWYAATQPPMRETRGAREKPPFGKLSHGHSSMTWQPCNLQLFWGGQPCDLPS